MKSQSFRCLQGFEFYSKNYRQVLVLRGCQEIMNWVVGRPDSGRAVWARAMGLRVESMGLSIP